MTDLQPCGTVAAYKRHRRRNEEVDQACQHAYDTAPRLAYTRALNRLRERHADEFAALLAEERAREVTPT